MFKTPQFLPPPEPFIATTKTYPSKNTTGTSTDNKYNQDDRGLTFVHSKSKQWKSRKAAAAPDVGYPSLFHAQQNELVTKAFKLNSNIK